jgi:hypothetical protein
MAGAAEAMPPYVCITHVPLPMAFPSYVTPLYVGQAQGPGRLNLRDLAPEWEPHHPVLGGTAGLFAARRWLLREHAGAVSVGVCQYRKFVSHARLSRQSARNYPAMDVVPMADLPLPRLTEAMRPGPEPFMVSPFVSLRRERGYLGQYGRVHHAQDLLRFAGEAVDQGVIESGEADLFMSERDLIPGGLDLGVFPMEFWLSGMGAIESVLRACIDRYPMTRTEYQVRAWAFCAERLGSWLLLRHFRGGRIERGPFVRLRRKLPGHWAKLYFGRLNIVIEEGQKTYVPGGP